MFKKWTKTLAAWEPRVLSQTGKSIERRRIDQTIADAFDFLKPEGIFVDVIGPISEATPNGPGLRYLREPPKDDGLMLGVKQGKARGAFSASHTINGHSISFRLRYGNVRFMMTGDMNQEAMERMRLALPDVSLRSEILKAPHHGSADFDMGFLQNVGPVVSLILIRRRKRGQGIYSPACNLDGGARQSVAQHAIDHFLHRTCGVFKVMDMSTQLEAKPPARNPKPFLRSSGPISALRISVPMANACWRSHIRASRGQMKPIALPSHRPAISFLQRASPNRACPQSSVPAVHRTAWVVARGGRGGAFGPDTLVRNAGRNTGSPGSRPARRNGNRARRDVPTAICRSCR